MRAMVLDRPHAPLRLAEVQPPPLVRGHVLIKVHACGVCRTDLHVIDGELPNPNLPLIPGHEIVGTVYAKSSDVNAFEMGARVGVPWLGSTCGHCTYCLSERENLCDDAHFTGYHLNGGYADYACADHRYCFPLPDGYGDVEAAPLLCAGLIGYRSLAMCEDAETIGIYGFGSAAHIVTQVAKHQGRRVFAFTRPGDATAQTIATDLGAD
jgi:alcohol dehydrogenase, propanol-preferring